MYRWYSILVLSQPAISWELLDNGFTLGGTWWALFILSCLVEYELSKLPV